MKSLARIDDDLQVDQAQHVRDVLFRLKKSAARCGDLNSLQQLVGQFMRRELNAVASAWYYPAGNQIGQEAHIECLVAPAEGLTAALREQCLNAARTALKSTLPVESVIHDNQSLELTAVPLSASTGQCLLVIRQPSFLPGGALPGGLSAEVSASLILTSVALLIDEWTARQEAGKSAFDALSVAAMVDLISHVQGAADAPSACRRLADSLQSFLQSSTVFVGLCRSQQMEPRLAAISGEAEFDRYSEIVRLAEAALHESTVRASAALWPCVDPTNRHALMSHQQLAEHLCCRSLVSMPLISEEGQYAGAVMAVFGEKRDSRFHPNAAVEPGLFNGADSAEDITAQIPYDVSGLMNTSDAVALAGDAERFLRGTAAPLASCLLMIQKLADSRLIDWIRRGRSLVTVNRARTLLVLAGIITAAMLVRMPYKIRCTTELQPVLRRYVAAPFTGPLEECRVEPGDLVQKDQLLARMDGREIRWELAGVQADLNKAIKERNTHLNTHEFGSAAIARHEMQRLQNRTELLQHRDSSLEIRSPIDGIVVSGDHRQAEGVPLEQGQTLFEIAPLEKMIVELGIPEEDIRHVRAGQKVHLWLDAFPERVFEASLDQVRPRAELRENQNIFFAELQLANDDLQLRPGMRGTARVISDSHMLGWILFHKPVAHVLGWLGW